MLVSLFPSCRGLLIKSVRSKDASSELDSVVTFYGDDLDCCRLELQLQSLAAQFREGLRYLIPCVI